MSEESPLLLQTLLDIKQDIGELKTMTQTTLSALDKHVAEDKAVELRVKDMEIQAAKNTGGKRLMRSLGNVASVLLGAASGYFGAKYH